MLDWFIGDVVCHSSHEYLNACDMGPHFPAPKGEVFIESLWMSSFVLVLDRSFLNRFLCTQQGLRNFVWLTCLRQSENAVPATVQGGGEPPIDQPVQVIVDRQ